MFYSRNATKSKIQPAYYNNIEEMQKNTTLGKINKLKLKIMNDRSRINKQNQQRQLPFTAYSIKQIGSETNINHKIISHSKIKKNEKNEKTPLKSKKLILDDINNKESLKIEQIKNPRVRIKKMFSCIPSFRKYQLIQKQPDNQQLIEELDLTQQIIILLKDNEMLIEQSVNYISMKKQDLSLLIVYLVSLISANNGKAKQRVSFRYEKCSNLKDSVEKLKQVVMGKYYKDNLCIVQNIYDLGYSSKEFSNNSIAYNNKYSQVLQQLIIKQNQLNQLQNERLRMKQAYKTNEALQKQKIYLQKQIQSLATIHDQYKVDILRKKQYLQLVNSQYSKYFNYLNKDNCKIIESICEEYKTIQKEVNEYIIFLQSQSFINQVACELNSFADIEDDINEQMNKVNKTIIQDIEILPELKERMMRNFIQRTMQKFRMRNIEMVNLNNFKTNCIRTYIQHMKKWLDNGKAKQQYLLHLRKQFAYDSHRLCQKLQILKCQSNLSNGKQVSTQVNNGFVQKIEQIKGITNKILQNYRLSNSFI